MNCLVKQFTIYLGVVVIFVECYGSVKVLCWIDRAWSSKECVCYASDPSVDLDDSSIGFVCVCVCRRLFPHLEDFAYYPVMDIFSIFYICHICFHTLQPFPFWSSNWSSTFNYELHKFGYPVVITCPYHISLPLLMTVVIGITQHSQIFTSLSVFHGNAKYQFNHLHLYSVKL